MKIPIDELIDIVATGGSVKLGVDVYNDKNILLLDKNAFVKDTKLLLRIKAAGIKELPINSKKNGGLWDKNGKNLYTPALPAKTADPQFFPAPDSLKRRIQDIHELKILAAEKYSHAKNCIKTVIKDIKNTGGEFDFNLVENTVNDILDFLIENENGFSHLTKEIFSYDDYLYNHSINVCTIATAVLQKFNPSSRTNSTLQTNAFESLANGNGNLRSDFIFTLEEIRNISTAFFLHDVGKVLIPEDILNKNGPLTDEERNIVQCHSYEKGAEILEKNRINDPVIKSIVKHHHSAIYRNEPGAYPADSPLPAQIPIYVKIGKLADIFDAMTTKRCYKDALNPAGVVYNLFRQYANKDNFLQIILHSFVKTIGIYPAGSIVKLRNGQQVYVIDSEGPVVLPFTDTSGDPLSHPADPLNLKEVEDIDPFFSVDRETELVSPIAVYEQLPNYIRNELLI
jgi:cyclic di-GMP phosphodiesterase